MLLTEAYDRERAFLYAEKWAFAQNPLFTDYAGIGGNCTNFVSQCLLAGCCVMNFTPVFGWFYISDRDRSPSWTGVRYLYDFLIGNNGPGPFGTEVAEDALETGDVIQLGREGDGFYHSLLVVGRENGTYLVAAQTDNAFNRPLSTYSYDFARYIHIRGARVDLPDFRDCFEALYAGERLFVNGFPLSDTEGTEEGSLQTPPPELPEAITPQEDAPQGPPPEQAAPTPGPEQNLPEQTEQAPRPEQAEENRPAT